MDLVSYAKNFMCWGECRLQQNALTCTEGATEKKIMETVREENSRALAVYGDFRRREIWLRNFIDRIV